MYKAHRKTSVKTQTTVSSEIYANSVKRHICDVKICDQGMINLYISKQQSDFAVSRGFYFHEILHVRSFAKLKPSRKLPNLQ